MYITRVLKIYPPNQGTYVLNGNSLKFQFGFFDSGNEENGPQPIVFGVSKFPESIIKNNDENLYFEFLSDMLSIFNIINCIRQEPNDRLIRIDKEDGMYTFNETGERSILVKENYIISNIFKNTYFDQFELDKYVDIYSTTNDFYSVIKYREFVNNLLLSSLNHEVFMLSYLWSEMMNNTMYSVVNAYKIYEIAKNLNLKENNITHNQAKLFAKEFNFLLSEIHKKHLGKFANNMAQSGAMARHGKSSSNIENDNGSYLNSGFFDVKIELMHKDIIKLIKMYCIIVTNYHYFDR
ncbi:hypothetical protein [Enterococcus faecium]|uniref:hypothetical protein n=1 Tax=Enterococcus TaxID=1350 RepID=UPI000A33313D|nr:hypothetical protein [Enterococcus faecium]OTN78285.1 hypothetical protein A5826_002137 [Enterococcus faecium]